VITAPDVVTDPVALATLEAIVCIGISIVPTPKRSFILLRLNVIA